MSITINAITTVGTPGGMAAAQPAIGGTESGSFAQVLDSAASSLRHAESTAMAGLRGETPTTEVVQSIMEAERSFHTALAIRDKLVTAWQEVSRMAI